MRRMIAKTVSKMLDDYSVRRVENMKGYKVVTAPAPQVPDTVQMDELEDWNVVQSNNLQS